MNICMCVYIYICIYMYIHRYTHLYMYTYTYAKLCMFINIMCTCLYCCICVCASIWCHTCFKFDLSALSSILFRMAAPVCATSQHSENPWKSPWLFTIRTHAHVRRLDCMDIVVEKNKSYIYTLPVGHTHVWRLDCMRINVHKAEFWLEYRGQIQRMTRNNSKTTGIVTFKFL